MGETGGQIRSGARDDVGLVHMSEGVLNEAALDEPALDQG